MTELSQFKENHPKLMASGELAEVKDVGAMIKAVVSEQIAEGYIVPAHVKLARDVIRNTVAYNGETQQDIIPNNTLIKACQNTSSQAVKLALSRDKTY